ncbi:unnamed protein product [Closterium sp. Naga37s-1]|nr:unnamed protein product [Closterium sp. Naga37s-1]
MLLGQYWIYLANADILTSKGQIVYRVNTKETDSVPITTGPVGTGCRPSYVSLPPQTPRKNDHKPSQHWSGMDEEDFQRWLEKKQLLLAEEQGRIRLTEEEADYWAWVQEEEELDRAELEALELKEREFYEELGADGLDDIPEGGEPEGEVGTDNDMSSLFESDGKHYSDLGATDMDEEAGELQWDMGYEEARKAVEAKGEIMDQWEEDSMTDGEEYVVDVKEEGKLAYEGKEHRTNLDYLWEEHLEHLREVFEQVKANHLLLKPNKCELGFYSTIYLGHIVTRDGVKPDAGKVEAISNMSAPVDVKGVPEFLGCTSYYRRFIKGYAKVAHPLTQLVYKDPGKGSSSSVDGEGEGGDSGEEEEGERVDVRESEEMSSNTEKREGEEEGDVVQAGSEGSKEGDGDEESREEGDEAEGSEDEDGEDEGEEEESGEGDEEMVAPGHFRGEFEVLLEKFGIYHEFSRPNHPRSSGLIERFQRTLKGALVRLGETNPFEWDENIWVVLLGYRGSNHSSTNFSPFFLLYGRHPNISGSNLTEWELKELTELSTVEEADAAAGYIYERSSEMELALAKAAENHDNAQEKQKVDFDRR